MADLDGLRQRVEHIDLRLKTANRAREKESAALMDMWEQIRERFVEQNDEIIQLRIRVSDLEDTRDDLLQMVHGLLSAVEGGLERMSDETVPRIREMAHSLLEGDSAHPSQTTSVIFEPSPENTAVDEVPQPEPQDLTPTSNFHDELLSAIEQSIENVRHSTALVTDDCSNKALQKVSMRAAHEPASPGIRDLVTRIENAVGPDMVDAMSENDDDDLADDDLTRDLREIEALRGELNGLRERIASGR